MSASFQLTDAERARAERIDELVASGGVGELVANLSDVSWTVRRAAVAGLAALGDDAVVTLCDWVRYRRTSENAIAAAVDALVASRGRTVTEHVTALLHDASPDVVADAAQILGRRRTPEAVADLRSAVANPNDNVAISAIEALGRIGGASGIDTLIAATRSGNFFRVFAAVQVLANTGDPRAIEPLAALLREPMYRSAATTALGQTGSVQAVPALASLVDGEPDDALLLACALGDLIARAEWNGSGEHVVGVLRDAVGAAIPRFAALLRDAAPDDAQKIALVVGRLGGTAELATLAALVDTALHDAALAAILAIVKRHDEAVAGVLGAADARVRAAVLPIVSSVRCAPVIRSLLADEDDETRALACAALARLGDTSAIPQLFAALEDPRPRVALAATGAIHSLQTTDTEARTIQVLREGSPSARRHALRIVSYLGFAKALDVVRAAVKDPDPRISELAIATLGTAADPSVDADLRALLASDQAPVTRAAAMRAIAGRGGSVERLTEALDDELAWVRYYACQGLGRAGHIPAIPALITKLRDSSPHVRLAAIEALSSIDAPAAWNAVLGAAASTDPDELRAALLGIGHAPHEGALPLLLAAAASADVATRIVALSGLARHPDNSALAAIIAAALEDIPEVRDAAVSLVAERTDRPAADALIAIAVGADGPLHPAHAALSRPSQARIAALRARCATADERTAIALTAALGRMHDPRATAALLELLAVPNPVSRRVAATVLLEIGTPGARELVSRMSREDPDPAVRHACAAASQDQK